MAVEIIKTYVEHLSVVRFVGKMYLRKYLLGNIPQGSQYRQNLPI